jgi:glycerophosphoryl diester phosphodiesterase
MKLATAFLLSLGLLAAAPPPSVKWIAHRGGVVDARYSENSPASLEAAVQHGYWMIESDIRETKDGQVITQHDPDFQRFYGDPRTVSAMTLAEIRKLRANPGGTPPMTFRELSDACKGRLRIMLDVKEPEHGVAFYNEIERELRRAQLLESTYVIGLDSAKRHLHGKARVSVNSAQLKAAVARKEDVGKLYFLFEWGKTLTREQVDFARAHGVPVVPSINTFHYGRDMDASIAAGGADVKRLLEWGITEFQIDSVYEPAFR